MSYAFPDAIRPGFINYQVHVDGPVASVVAGNGASQAFYVAYGRDNNKEESTMSEGNDLKPLTPNRGAPIYTDDLFAVYPWLDQYQTAAGPSDGTEFARKLRLAAEHVRGAQALEELDIPNAILDYAANWEQDEPQTGGTTVFHGDENGAKLSTEDSKNKGEN